MSGLPADYVDFDSSGSEMDEIVFADDDFHLNNSKAKTRTSPTKALSAEQWQLPSAETATLDHDYTAYGVHEHPEDVGIRVPAELQEDFRVAVSRGNVSMVRDLLDQGVAVQMPSRGNWSALVQACSDGCLEMVQLLLDHGMDPNGQEAFLTPLMAVCGSQKQTEETLESCAVALLKHGADPNLAESKGQATPLMVAAREGHCRLLQLLLSHGADVSRQDSRGWCAVSWAAYAGQGRSARTLLHLARPDPLSLITLDGQMPSDLAIGQGCHTLGQTLLKYETEYQQGDGNVVPDDEIAAGMPSPRGFKDAFGDVSLMLAAMGAEHLLPTFESHGVGFREMLTLDDAALSKMGVESASERTKLLEGIQSTRRFQVHSHVPCTGMDLTLESFLSALDLSDLADTLHEHGVSTLDALLRLDDAGLEKAGVAQVGLRGRLGAAIQRAHQMPWHKSSVVDLRSSNPISCPAAVSLVSNVSQHLVHLEGSLCHLWRHLRQRPQDLQLGRDLCSVRHLRDELETCSQALAKVKAQMGQLDALAAQVEGCPQYQQQWPPLPGVKTKRQAPWLPLLLLAATWWACKSSGLFGRLPQPPYWSWRSPA
ncbi:ankyrin repeat, SAM and basic leucine zipper domain-containing protein 1 [Ixodes scapularis]|uniref:ankyrin repeat, SAM and basic leucine zipper domain-containing protein 1 n=1 Tax=Ixodes scapularis TaxID=6945 RepID=UPI001A9F0768|nr:ankyrin repeat, SAM and basic leucine zipper domain-containing protein 1 [Ixodes scapularis]